MEIVVVVKGLVFCEGKALLVQRAFDEEVGGGEWECPGGKIDPGEGLEEALQREMMEEAQLSVGVERILFATTFSTGDTRQVLLLTYLCRSAHQAVTLSAEHVNHRWVTREDILKSVSAPVAGDFVRYGIPHLDAWHA